MIYSKFIRGLKHPVKSFKYLKSVFKGQYYKTKYSIFNKNIKIGKNFRIQGRLIIKGPGKISIGDNVNCGGIVTPWTYSPDAEIIIGNGVFLNGPRFGCKSKIVIEDDCILADCRILDTDFHSIDPDRRNDPDYILTRPIFVKRNVWITMDCIILKGVTIGENSTITPNSVVNSDVPPNAIFGGNPAKLIKNVSES